MRKDNTPNYQTSNSKITHFRDFTDNVKKERDELEDINRSFTKNDNQVGNLSDITKKKFNKVTRKIDDLSKDEVEDKIKSMDDNNINHTDHVFKIKEMKNIISFKSYNNIKKINNNVKKV